jgi:hypothetical protein
MFLITDLRGSLVASFCTFVSPFKASVIKFDNLVLIDLILLPLLSGPRRWKDKLSEFGLVTVTEWRSVIFMLWQEAHFSSALVRSTTVPVVCLLAAKMASEHTSLVYLCLFGFNQLIELFRVPLSPCVAYAFLNNENRAKPRIGCVCLNRHGGRLRQ